MRGEGGCEELGVTRGSWKAVEVRAGESLLYTPLSSIAPHEDPNTALNTLGAGCCVTCLP